MIIEDIKIAQEELNLKIDAPVIIAIGTNYYELSYIQACEDSNYTDAPDQMILHAGKRVPE